VATPTIHDNDTSLQLVYYLTLRGMTCSRPLRYTHNEEQTGCGNVYLLSNKSVALLFLFWRFRLQSSGLSSATLN